MKRCKANDEGTPCDFPVEGGGYCHWHQKELPYERKLKPCMKSHKSKKYEKLSNNISNRRTGCDR